MAGAAGVVFADINIEAAKGAAEDGRCQGQHPAHKAIAVAADVTMEEDVSSLIDHVVSEFGRINYADNSAGVRRFATIDRDIRLMSGRLVSKHHLRLRMPAQPNSNVSSTSIRKGLSYSANTPL